MAIPPDVQRQLKQAAETSRGEERRIAKRQQRELAKERAEARQERRARRASWPDAQLIWAWAHGDDVNSLCTSMHRSRLVIILVTADDVGHDICLSLSGPRLLVMYHSAYAFHRDVESLEELADVSQPKALRALAAAIRDGSVWKPISMALEPNQVRRAIREDCGDL